MAAHERAWTLGAAVTSVALPNVEAAILMKKSKL
jgi:hypothetical protein